MRNLIVLFSLIALPTSAAVPTFRPENGTVRFVARGKPALIKIEGNGEGATGTLEKMGATYKGSFTFRLSTLKTGIELRDEHMKTKYLEVANHPEAELTFEDVKLSKGKNSFPAKLILHGVEQLVTVSAEVTDVDGKRKVKAEIPLKLSAFKIPVPSFQGITVAEDLSIFIEANENP